MPTVVTAMRAVGSTVLLDRPTDMLLGGRPGARRDDHAGPDHEQLCDALLDVVAGRTEDDVALLALRISWP